MSNETVEFVMGAKFKSVIDQTRTIRYSESVTLGEKGLIKKLQQAEKSMIDHDQTPVMYPMFMAEFEMTPSLFLGCVIMQKMLVLVRSNGSDNISCPLDFHNCLFCSLSHRIPVRLS